MFDSVRAVVRKSWRCGLIEVVGYTEPSRCVAAAIRVFVQPFHGQG